MLKNIKWEKLKLEKLEGDLLNLKDYANFDYFQWSDLIDRWIFNEDHREILKMKLLDAKTFQYISDKKGLTVRQIQNIVDKCSKELLLHIWK